MLNKIMLICASAAMTMSANAAPKTEKPAPPPPGGTIIVEILPFISQEHDNNNSDINQSETQNFVAPFTMPDENPENNDADTKYQELKAKLDEKFGYMFALKTEIESAQGNLTSKWEEYNALRSEYERQLKKLIALWVTMSNY